MSKTTGEPGRPRRRRRSRRRRRIETALLILGIPLLFALLALSVELIEHQPENSLPRPAANDATPTHPAVDPEPRLPSYRMPYRPVDRTRRAPGMEWRTPLRVDPDRP